MTRATLGAPPTAREREVAGLVAEGLTDRQDCGRVADPARGMAGPPGLKPVWRRLTCRQPIAQPAAHIRGALTDLDDMKSAPRCRFALPTRRHP